MLGGEEVENESFSMTFLFTFLLTIGIAMCGLATVFLSAFLVGSISGPASELLFLLSVFMLGTGLGFLSVWHILETLSEKVAERERKGETKQKHD